MVDTKRAWYARMSFAKLCELYVVAVLEGADGDRQVVCGFPKLDIDNRVVIRLNGQDIPLLESNGQGEWTLVDGVVDFENLYHVTKYEQLALKDTKDDDSALWVGKIKVFGLRERGLPNEPGLYLDAYGETWVLNECGEWQNWDFPDGTYESFSDARVIDFAPFTPAKVVGK